MRRSYKYDFSYRLRHSKRWIRRCRRCVHFHLFAYYKCDVYLECPWLAEMRMKCVNFSDCVQLELFNF